MNEVRIVGNDVIISVDEVVANMENAALIEDNKRLQAENEKLRELVKDLLNAWDDMQHEVVTGPTFDDCERRAYELGIEVDA